MSTDPGRDGLRSLAWLAVAALLGVAMMFRFRSRRLRDWS
jgi:hypothetical protein